MTIPEGFLVGGEGDRVACWVEKGAGCFPEGGLRRGRWAGLMVECWAGLWRVMQVGWGKGWWVMREEEKWLEKQLVVGLREAEGEMGLLVGRGEKGKGLKRRVREGSLTGMGTTVGMTVGEKEVGKEDLEIQKGRM